MILELGPNPPIIFFCLAFAIRGIMRFYICSAYYNQLLIFFGLMQSSTVLWIAEVGIERERAELAKDPNNNCTRYFDPIFCADTNTSRVVAYANKQLAILRAIGTTAFDTLLIGSSIHQWVLIESSENAFKKFDTDCILYELSAESFDGSNPEFFARVSVGAKKAHYIKNIAAELKNTTIITSYGHIKHSVQNVSPHDGEPLEAPNDEIDGDQLLILHTKLGVEIKTECGRLCQISTPISLFFQKDDQTPAFLFGDSPYDYNWDLAPSEDIDRIGYPNTDFGLQTMLNMTSIAMGVKIQKMSDFDKLSKKSIYRSGIDYAMKAMLHLPTSPVVICCVGDSCQYAPIFANIKSVSAIVLITPTKSLFDWRPAAPINIACLLMGVGNLDTKKIAEYFGNIEISDVGKLYHVVQAKAAASIINDFAARSVRKNIA